MSAKNLQRFAIDVLSFPILVAAGLIPVAAWLLLAIGGMAAVSVLAYSINREWLVAGLMVGIVWVIFWYISFDHLVKPLINRLQNGVENFADRLKNSGP
ncbi:MAG: hypothetical protein JNL81_11675 [Hyphomonadaceae bacterium]|nr:hypothetical protein [Hyphomonadaceae bacterium]